MVAGDLIQRNGQYEFRGLLLGGGGDFIVEEVDGLFDLPNMAAQDEERQDQHGFFPGAILSSGRTIQMDIHALARSETDTSVKLDLLMAAFKTTRSQEPLVFQRAGWGKRRVYGRVHRRAFPSNYELAHGHINGSVMISCADPRMYSNDEHTASWNLASGSSTSQGATANLGNEPVAPIVTLGGAWVNPIITNQADENRAVRLNITTSTSDTLVINFKTRTVTRNGTDVTSSVVRQDSRWWDIMPGSNLITAARTGTTGNSNVSVRFRHAWM